MSLRRCTWADASPLEQAYHDREWGRPVHDDRILFESLILDGAQAGLSWSLILAKRENYRAAFDNFDANKIARYPEKKIQALLTNPGIVRNHLKVRSAVSNAQAFLAVQEEFGSFDSYIWRFVDGRMVRNAWTKASEVPTTSKASDAMAKDLKKRGFKFVGSTICYAFMQGVGMVNDHTTDCHLYKEIDRLGSC